MKRFTLVELLVVIAIMAVLASSLVIAIPYVINRARVAKAKGEMTKLQTAVANYKFDYKKLPMISGGALISDGVLKSSIQDATSESSEYRRLLRILSNTSTVTNDRRLYNPKSIIFWEPSNTFQDEGLLDPWGNPYVFWFDCKATGYAGTPNGTEYQKAVGAVHIFSYGPNYEGRTDYPVIKLPLTNGIVSTIE